MLPTTRTLTKFTRLVILILCLNRVKVPNGHGTNMRGRISASHSPITLDYMDAVTLFRFWDARDVRYRCRTFRILKI